MMKTWKLMVLLAALAAFLLAVPFSAMSKDEPPDKPPKMRISIDRHSSGA